MYKKLLAVAAVAFVGTAAASTAFAQDTAQTAADQNALNTTLPNAKGGWYIDLGAGASMRGISNHYTGNSYAGSLSGGYLFPVSPDLSVGPELGYVYLGHQSPGIGYNNNYHASGNYHGRDGDNRLRGITLGANLRLNLTPGWYLSLHGGAFDAHGSGLSTDYAAPERRSFNNSIGYYVGVGTGWDISQHWSVGVTADYYKAGQDTKGGVKGTDLALDTEVFGVKGEYRF